MVDCGPRTFDMGEVREVKAVGVFSMIDSGELDWKVLAIAIDDPLVTFP